MAVILVVDDDPFLRKLLVRALSGAGYQTQEASNGLEALECCSRAVPDLIVTDLMMPEMDGLELITTIHKTNPKVRILAISGGGKGWNNMYLSVSSRLGAHKVLAKPFEAEALLRTVSELLAA